MHASEKKAAVAEKPRSRWRRRIWGLVVVLTVLGALVAQDEFRTSRLEARYFAGVDRHVSFTLGKGPSDSITFPNPGGPYDDRLGYSHLPVYLKRLQSRGYQVVEQARQSPRMQSLAVRGYFVPYHEKDQAGLTLVDSRGGQMHAARDPGRVYASFKTLPPGLINSLVYVENHTLLQTEQAHRNPAVEWPRLGKAVIEQVTHPGGHHQAGGSTLATQIEKYRHSPDGRTTSASEKWRQMMSASLRAYLNGEDTTLSRQQLVLNYINTVPLAARAGFGEISGIGDGMWAWYGRDFAQVNNALAAKSTVPLKDRAIIYKEALSLFVSQRSPSYFLDGDMKVLEGLTNSYLRLMSKDGVISAELCSAALGQSLEQQKELVRQPPPSQVETKGVNAVRNKVASLLGESRMYDLERRDLTVSSTIDASLQQAVTDQLLKLRDGDYAKSVGMSDEHLLLHGAPEGVTYSFTLLEKTPTGNKVRVQTDNFDQPFDINEGTKLDLGSTSKLRTLITYLEIIADLHDQYANTDIAVLKAIPSTEHESVLRRWAIDYLIQNKDHSLKPMLEAALDRKYSGNPGEVFFTGGGMHVFGNFDKSENSQIMDLREATAHSVNLVYIRLMRDVVRYYMALDSDPNASILDDENDPRRQAYLQHFADREGQTFLVGFYRKYQGKSEADAQDTLLENLHVYPKRLAVIYRSIVPNGDASGLAAFLAANDPDDALDPSEVQQLFSSYGPDKFDLQDRGYLAGVHPLELWLLAYLHEHPKATLHEVIKASAGERQEVYRWLLHSHRKAAQDNRIKQLLEVEGFIQVHKAWKRLGYPFDSLVPSYASALGASADRPAALAELMGIIQNNGMRVPTGYIETLHFASGTPYETVMAQATPPGEQVLRPEIAQLVKTTIADVVNKGTARRVAGAFDSPDGSVHVPIGGKTGTGDNRFKSFARPGVLKSERVVSRSGAFVFYLGDRYFGTVVAYVAGPKAADYQFTSALPVQVLKVLAPVLKQHLALGGVPVPGHAHPAVSAASGAASGMAASGKPQSAAHSGKPASTSHSGHPGSAAASGENDDESEAAALLAPALVAAHSGKAAATAHSGHAAPSAHSGKPESSAHSGRVAGSAHSGKPAATALSGQAAFAAHSGHVAATARSGKPESAAHSGKPASSAHSGTAAAGAHSGHSSAAAAPSGKPAATASSGKVAATAHSGNVATTAHSGKPASAAHSGKPASPAHSGAAADGAHSGRVAASAHSGKPAATAHTGKPAASAHSGSRGVAAASAHSGRVHKPAHGGPAAPSAASAHPAVSHDVPAPAAAPLPPEPAPTDEKPHRAANIHTM